MISSANPDRRAILEFQEYRKYRTQMNDTQQARNREFIGKLLVSTTSPMKKCHELGGCGNRRSSHADHSAWDRRMNKCCKLLKSRTSLSDSVTMVPTVNNAPVLTFPPDDSSGTPSRAAERLTGTNGIFIPDCPFGLDVSSCFFSASSPFMS